MTRYTPEEPPQNLEQVLDYLKRETIRISEAIDGLADGRLEPSYTEPPRPRNGDFRYADGTSFNPGLGEGHYGYENGAWVKWGVGTASAGLRTFIALTDTPATYSGQALRKVRVNAGATALEFTTDSAGISTPTYSLSDLSDVDIVDVTNGESLLYNSGTGNFENTAPAGLTGITNTLNTALGIGALGGITSGAVNMGLGLSAGASYTTEFSNVCIGHGIEGTAGDNNVIRIGTNSQELFIGNPSTRYLTIRARVVEWRNVIAKTADYTIPTVSADNTESNTIYTNQAASGTINFTLPAATSGLNSVFTFIVVTAQTLKVTAGSGDSIRIAGSVTSIGSPNGDISSSTIGDVVMIVNVNSTEWIAISTIGTWTVT